MDSQQRWEPIWTSGLQHSGLLSQYPFEGRSVSQGKIFSSNFQSQQVLEDSRSKTSSFSPPTLLPGLSSHLLALEALSKGHWPLARGVSFLVFQQTLSLTPSLPASTLQEEDRPTGGQWASQ